MILAPVSLTNSRTERPMGPAPMMRQVSSGLGGAVDGVTADGEGFDEGELFVVKLDRDVQFAGREDEAEAEAAIAVDAEDFEALAAVGPAAATGVAGRVVNVRLDGAAVAGFNVGDGGADFENFDAEFVTENARVGEERHFAEVGADVGAADTDTVDADEGVAGARVAGVGEVEALELFRGGEGEGEHGRGRVRCPWSVVRGREGGMESTEGECFAWSGYYLRGAGGLGSTAGGMT